MMRRGLAGSRRGPGLIGAAARTAVVAGTATAVSGRVAQRQQDRAVPSARAQSPEQQPAGAVATPPPPAAGGLTDEAIATLKELAALKDQGILTEEEFAAQKVALLRCSALGG